NLWLNLFKIFDKGEPVDEKIRNNAAAFLAGVRLKEVLAQPPTPPPLRQARTRVWQEELHGFTAHFVSHDGRVDASVPSIPGCTAEGKRAADVRERLSIAILAHIRTMSQRLETLEQRLRTLEQGQEGEESSP